MRLFLLPFLAAASLWGQLAISTSNPAAVAGGTLNLTASGGTAPYTWSLSSGSVGSINPTTGQYTAPATVTVNHQAAGCQVFPSASIFSTKISNLPVHASSATWVGAITPSTQQLVLAPNYGLNIVTNSTPLFDVVNLSPPTANGQYPIAEFPWLKRQGGYYSHPQSGLDRHIANVNKDTCEFTEMYNTYPAGTTTECPTCTSQSSARYDGKLFKFQVGAGVDAAGLPLQPVTLKLSDFNDGVIKHPMRFTLPNNIIQPQHIWPATAHALAGGGGIPYGAWLRLKSSYDISGFSAKAQVVLQAWKDYGLFMADGGLTLEVTTDGDISQDKDVFAAIGEISGSGPQIASHFEFVDASSLMVSSSTAEVKHDNAYETPVDFAHACVTDAAMTTVCKYVALQGVTVGTTYTAMTFQAGADPVQLDSWVHGSANQSVSWAIIGTAIGTLSSGGSYTPPESVSSPTVTMFEGTAAADSNAKVRIYVVVWPAGVIRVDSARTTDYVGSEGTWFKEHGFDGGQGARTNEATHWSGIPADATLYHTMRYIYSNDLAYRWWLSPGNYKITLKWGIWSSTNSHTYKWGNGTIPERNWLMGVDTNGTVVKRRYDVGRGQGTFNTDHDVTIPCWVQEADNGLCYLAIRQIADKQTSSVLDKGFCWAGDPDGGVSQSVSGATNASPIVLTVPSGHGFLTGEYAYVSNVGGNTAANGFWRVSAYTATSITLEGTTGNGTYTSGGTAQEMPYGGNPADDPAACSPGINAIRLEADTDGPRIEVDGDTADITFSRTRQLNCVGWFIASTCTWQILSGPGSIDSTGLYTAPSIPPLSGSETVTVRATSTVDTGISADLSFDFVFGQIVVTRSVANIYRGQTAQFTAAINLIDYSSRVTWSRSGSQGSIDSNGLYTAPGSVSPDETLTITATSIDDGSETGTAQLDLAQLRPVIYMNAGNYPYVDNRFTDGAGVTWINDEIGVTSTAPSDMPVSYRTSTERGTTVFTTTVTHGPGCDANDATNRKQVYLAYRYDYQTEPPVTWTFTVPNGRYGVRVKYFTGNNTTAYLHDVILQGVTWQNDLNLQTLTGGTNRCADIETTAIVTNGTLAITFDAEPGGGGFTVSGIVLTDQGPAPANLSVTGGVSITGRVSSQ